jgi:hypothetical protein
MESHAQGSSAYSPREQDGKADSSSVVGDQFNNFALPQNIDEFLASPEHFLDLDVFSEAAPSSSVSVRRAITYDDWRVFANLFFLLTASAITARIPNFLKHSLPSTKCNGENTRRQRPQYFV